MNSMLSENRPLRREIHSNFCYIAMHTLPGEHIVNHNKWSANPAEKCTKGFPISATVAELVPLIFFCFIELNFVTSELSRIASNPKYQKIPTIQWPGHLLWMANFWK